MNRLVYSLFLSVFFMDYLHFNLKVVPRAATWLPDFLALLIALIILFRLAVNKVFDLEKKYIYFIILYIMTMVCGIVWNEISPFKVLVGLRPHLKHLPIFLLPAVYRFSEDEFRKQLIFILPLLLLQTPVAIFQKIYTLFALRMSTGDAVQGTLISANTIAVAVLCAIAVLFAFYLKKQLSLKAFLLMSVCLFFPTTICESKATIFYLPIVLMVPSFLCEGYIEGKRKRNLFVASIIWIMGMGIFIPMYNVIVSPLEKDPNSFKSVATEKYLSSYLYSGVNEKKFFYQSMLGLESHKKGFIVGANIRRIDQIVMAYNHLYNQSTINLLTGDGIGITFQSYLDSIPNGAKPTLHDFLPQTADISFSVLLWEVGLTGLFVYLVFLFLLFRDSRFLSKSEDLFGVFSLGWCCAIIVIFMTMGYFSISRYNSINILFWYFSGIIAARAARLRRLKEESSCLPLYRPGALASGYECRPLMD